MRVIVNCNLGDLEDQDTIAGYKAKDLIIFAYAVKNAGISDDELSAFVKNAENAYEFIKLEQDIALRKAFESGLEQFNHYKSVS